MGPSEGPFPGQSPTATFLNTLVSADLATVNTWLHTLPMVKVETPLVPGVVQPEPDKKKEGAGHQQAHQGDDRPEDQRRRQLQIRERERRHCGDERQRRNRRREGGLENGRKCREP